MADSGKFSDKKFLLLDKSQKNINDRTWCFWETKPGYFEDIVYRSWEQLCFKNDKESIELDISPYRYKMIRGLDFYTHAFSRIKSLNIDFRLGDIIFNEPAGNKDISFNGEVLPEKNAIVFNSIYRPTAQPAHFNLLQHFKGWIIETPSPIFDPGKGTLMDFSISQRRGTAFVYVLPLAPTKALVEYTLFTAALLTPADYKQALQDYLKNNLKLDQYTISEEEFGVIPMTNRPFVFNQHGVYNIGTAGGQTKPSTGYTFQFIQKQADQLLGQLLKSGKPAGDHKSAMRFNFYDSTFLHILSNNKVPGSEVFSKLFKNNKASAVFKFLDNETTINEELKLISSLPTLHFLRAGISEIFKKIF